MILVLTFLIDLRKCSPDNPLIGYININCLKEKVIPLREVLLNAPIDILCVDKIKLGSSFSDHQLRLKDTSLCYSGEIETQRTGGLVYLRKCSIVKRIPKLETEKARTTWIKIPIAKKKWCILFAYCPRNFLKTEFLKKFQWRSIKL